METKPSDSSAAASPTGLEGQVVIVTGGASGIGRATCRALLGAGARVVALDRDGAGLERLASEADTPDSLETLVLDVRREEDMATMTERTVERFGRIDALVASAGVLHGEGARDRELVDLEVQQWDEIIDTNLRGVFLSNRAVLGTMVAQKSGQILNLSSTLGRAGRANDAAYCATKFGVIGMTESLQQEVSRHGVKVNVVLPDPVETPSSEAGGEEGAPQLSPEHVATVILTLLTLPADTILLEPVVARFGGRTRRKKRSRKP